MEYECIYHRLFLCKASLVFLSQFTALTIFQVFFLKRLLETDKPYALLHPIGAAAYSRRLSVILAAF
jgi:hypothetical protein